ncbi:glycerophosphodiester phosphodiesterase family protein [Microbaculum marinum]|uniref:glycerophosphodiester phosphodiesterase n=1 Tax=Microbaculum marinum TaxID=1764581 RepID=A0AAW9RGV8_9HYPH
MHSVCRLLALAGLAAGLLAAALPAAASDTQPDAPEHWSTKHPINVQVGPRPYYLIDKLDRGPLKRKLERCENQEVRKTNFSIAHRGAPLQFPEHTEESYRAAARMGAGIVECDVTFTKDGELVCRHSQCDLHTTTNILETELAGTCEQGFQPAEFDADGNRTRAASAKCCTSGLTLAEFKSLKGKMDGANSSATTVEEYLGGTADFRTDLYSTGGTLLSHKESIKLFKQLGVSMTPELKGVDSAVGFGDSGFTQKSYAARMIRDYIDAGISPRKVWPQSFDIGDVYYWIKKFPDYGKRAVFLDGDGTATTGTFPPAVADFRALRKKGVNIVAPSIPYLLTLDSQDNMIASDYARNARKARMKVISWSMERSGRIVEDVIEGSPGYYSTVLDGLKNDGDIIRSIDVLARDAGVIGLFSDWPGTVSYYASCMGLK